MVSPFSLAIPRSRGCPLRVNVCLSSLKGSTNGSYLGPRMPHQLDHFRPSIRYAHPCPLPDVPGRHCLNNWLASFNVLKRVRCGWDRVCCLESRSAVLCCVGISVFSFPLPRRPSRSRDKHLRLPGHPPKQCQAGFIAAKLHRCHHESIAPRLSRGKRAGFQEVSLPFLRLLFIRPAKVAGCSQSS
jgi:hypothetical protein